MRLELEERKKMKKKLQLAAAFYRQRRRRHCKNCILLHVRLIPMGPAGVKGLGACGSGSCSGKGIDGHLPLLSGGFMFIFTAWESCVNFHSECANRLPGAAPNPTHSSPQIENVDLTL